MNHAVDLAVGCHYFLPGLRYLRSFHQMALPVNDSTHLIPAYYSFIDPDPDAAVEARIRIGWNKFRQLVPLLTNKDVSLIMRGRLYSSCVSRAYSKRVPRINCAL